ncbi:MAG TPA: hypothetical protein PLQ95_05390 [Thiobacillus sp.]|nr:hypothetical protein [Thiobacillus sp.]
MSTRIFVNLPVADLAHSIAFFARLGFSFDEKFTNDSATCMVVGDNIFSMLLRERFQSFTSNPVCDATQSTEVLPCLSRYRTGGGCHDARSRRCRQSGL